MVEQTVSTCLSTNVSLQYAIVNFERTTLKRMPLALALGMVVLAIVVIVTTRTTKTLGVTFYENTTFKFQLSVIPNDAVDIRGQRFWAATWPGGVKCVAGINVPLSNRQFTI